MYQEGGVDVGYLGSELRALKKNISTTTKTKALLQSSPVTKKLTHFQPNPTTHPIENPKKEKLKKKA